MNRFKLANLVCVLALAAATSMWPADGVQAEDAEGIVQQREALAHRQRRIIFNNDGDDAMRAEKAGLTNGLTFVTGGDLREDFLRSRTSALANTHVDTISYCTTAIGLTFHHATKVGHFLDKETFEGCLSQDLMEQYGVDTLGAQVEFCRQHGLEIFWSLRMNDRHDSHPAGTRRWTYGLSPFKRDHPKYLFGVPEDWYKYGRENQRRAWSGVDYSYPEVREHIFRLIQEVCEGYDIDGVEMDFFRAPPYFPPGLDNQPARPEHLDMMTGLVRRIRRMADEVGTRRGRPILLAPRVPLTAELSRFYGLDVEQWLKEGLVDLVLAGHGNWRFRPTSMIGQAVELGHQYNVPVYAALAAFFDHPWQYIHLGGGLSGRRSWPPTGTLQAWRGASMSAWGARADGIYTFNVWDPNNQLFREIGDPDVMAGLDKIYGVAHFGSISGPPVDGSLAGSTKTGKYDVALTVELKEGQGVSADLRVGNDVHSETVSELWLRVHLAGTTGEEEVTIKLNEVGLTTSVVKDKTGHWLECLLEPSQMRIGVNKFQVMLNKRDPSTQEPILLNGLLLQVRHQGS